jgi:hypothetical protein
VKGVQWHGIELSRTQRSLFAAGGLAWFQSAILGLESWLTWASHPWKLGIGLEELFGVGGVGCVWCLFRVLWEGRQGRLFVCVDGCVVVGCLGKGT